MPSALSQKALYDDNYFSQIIASRFWLPEAGRCLSEMLPSIDEGGHRSELVHLGSAAVVCGYRRGFC